MAKHVLTRSGLERSRSRLKELETELKEVSSQKAEAAETGGNVWHDNFSFEELAKREQSLMFEISKLKDIIANAAIDDEIPVSEAVNIGSKVLLRFDDGREAEYKVVGFMESNPDENCISYNSPVGKAIMGCKRGDKKEFIAGKTKRVVEIIEIIH